MATGRSTMPTPTRPPPRPALRDICQALGFEDLSKEERFATLERQKEHRPELQALFRARFAQGTTKHWVERLEAVDILCAPVRTLAEALEDPQTIINKMIVELAPSKGGPVKLMGTPIDMSDAALEVRHAPPKLGEHNGEILRELGLSPARVLQ